VVVELRGLEPLTPCLQIAFSTWAKDAELGEGLPTSARGVPPLTTTQRSSHPLAPRYRLSKPSRRTVPLPDPLVQVLREHRVRQEKERITAGSLWRDSPCVFTTTVGTPVEPRNDYRQFKQLLARADLPVLFSPIRWTASG